jgi:hypothetical protein
MVGRYYKTEAMLNIEDALTTGDNKRQRLMIVTCYIQEHTFAQNRVGTLK